MSVLRKLYTRFVLWLIAPELELRAKRECANKDKVISIFVSDIHNGGRLANAMESIYGVRRKGV